MVKRIKKYHKRIIKRKQKLEIMSLKETRKKRGVYKRSAEKKYAVFLVGEEKFCISLDSIHEILHTFIIHSASYLPKVFSGVINVRGKSMPVVNLQELLKEKKTEIGTRVCLVASVDSTRIGFLVDSDVEIVTSQRGTLHLLPDCYTKEESEFLDGIFSVGGEFIGILKPQEVVKVLANWREEDEKL